MTVFEKLDDAVGFGSDQMAANKDVHRVMFFPFNDPPLDGMADDNTLIVLVKELIHPNWHMITRDIGLGETLCERSLMDALLQMETKFTSEDSLRKPRHD